MTKLELDLCEEIQARADEGCELPYRDRTCIERGPDAPVTWCHNCLHVEARKLIDSLRQEPEQILLPDKHPLRIRAEKAEAELAALQAATGQRR